jgi:hypothetical protein
VSASRTKETTVLPDASNAFDLADSRPRGQWRRTPGVLTWLGLPTFRRPVFAHGALGGGWDDWEYSDGRCRDL